MNFNKFVFVLCSCLILINSISCKANQNEMTAKQSAGTKQPATAKQSSASKQAAEKSASTAKSKVPLKPGSKEFLWKATTESGATLYLLGTIHVANSDFYPLPPEMEKAFEKSRSLLLEIDLSKQDNMKTLALVKQFGIYAPPDSLTQHMSESVADQLQKYCSLNQLPIANLLRMKPWLVAMTILQAELQRLGYSSAQGLDRHFLSEATTQGKKIIGLETEESQLSLFGGLSEDLQNQMLSLTFVDMELIEKDFGDILKAWKAGDDSGMDELSTKDLKEHPEYAPVQEKILYERNITMEQKLEPYLKGSDTFMCAVGAAHLVGNRSIIQILKDKGFKVTQVLAGDEI